MSEDFRRRFKHVSIVDQHLLARLTTVGKHDKCNVKRIKCIWSPCDHLKNINFISFKHSVKSFCSIMKVCRKYAKTTLHIFLRLKRQWNENSEFRNTKVITKLKNRDSLPVVCVFCDDVVRPVLRDNTKAVFFYTIINNTSTKKVKELLY